MKKLTFILILLFLTATLANAQFQSDYDRFKTEPGYLVTETLNQIGIYKVGKFQNSYNIIVYLIKISRENEIKTFVRIDTKKVSSNQINSSNYISIDEFNKLSQAITYIQTLSDPIDTFYSFTTINGFFMQAIQTEKGLQITFTININDINSNKITFKSNDFEKLKQIFASTK